MGFLKTYSRQIVYQNIQMCNIGMVFLMLTVYFCFTKVILYSLNKLYGD